MYILGVLDYIYLNVTLSNLNKREGKTKPELWKPDWVKVSMTNDENTSGGAFFDIPYRQGWPTLFTIFLASNTTQKQTLGVNLILSNDFKNEKMICVGGVLDRKWTRKYTLSPFATYETRFKRKSSCFKPDLGILNFSKYRQLSECPI